MLPESTVLEMGEVSAEGVARALDALYGDPLHRQELSRAAVGSRGTRRTRGMRSRGSSTIS